MLNHGTDRKDDQEELKYLVLKGCCPYCSSKNVHYRESLTNLEFGFDCFSCNWKGRYLVQEFWRFSQNWIELMKSKDPEV